MALNQDGIEAGQAVDFTTLMQIKAKQRGNQNGTGQEERKEDDRANKSESKNTFSTARKKKAQKG